MRALEKGEVEREAEEAAEVNMQKEMEKARIEVKEREDRKALTGVKTGEQEKPRMNVQVRILFLVLRVVFQWCAHNYHFTGRKIRLNGTGATPTDNPPHRCIPQSRGAGGEDCTGAEEQERGG